MMEKGKMSLALILMLFVSLCFAESGGNISVSGSNIETPPLWGIVETTTTTVTTTTTTTTEEENVTSVGPQGNTATTTTLLKKSQVWNSMTAGSTYTLTAYDIDAGFREVNITVNNTASNVMLTLTKLSAKPSTISKAVPGTVYKYINADLLNLAQTNIKSAKILFDVEKWWLSLNNEDKSRIHLYRYYGGKWELLETTFLSETSNYANYVAYTPGFSTFAITAGQVNETTTTLSTQENTTNTILESNETATTTTAGGSLGIFSGKGEDVGYEFMLLIMFLIGAGGLFYIKKDSLMAHIEKLRSKRKKEPHPYSHADKKHTENKHEEKKDSHREEKK